VVGKISIVFERGRGGDRGGQVSPSISYVSSEEGGRHSSRVVRNGANLFRIQTRELVGWW